MPTLPAEAMSLVFTRSTTSTGNARQDDSCEQYDPLTQACYGPPTKADDDAVLGVCIGVGGLFFCSLLWLGIAVVRKRLRESPHSISDDFRPSSEYFIFQSCCGKRTKHSEPLEQDYQPYEMMRPQGRHDAEAGVKKGFGDVGVSEV